MFGLVCECAKVVLLLCLVNPTRRDDSKSAFPRYVQTKTELVSELITEAKAGQSLLK